MSGIGECPVKKARKQAIFEASCFRAFGMKHGHSLRIHYGRRMEKYCRPVSVQPRGSSRYGRRNVAALKIGVWNFLRPQNRCAVVSFHTAKSVCDRDAPASVRIGPPGSASRRQNRCAFVRLYLSAPIIPDFLLRINPSGPKPMCNCGVFAHIDSYRFCQIYTGVAHRFLGSPLTQSTLVYFR